METEHYVSLDKGQKSVRNREIGAEAVKATVLG